LAPSVEQAVITGLRGRDLALRFKYRGSRRSACRLWTLERPISARSRSPRGGEVVVCHYTAMQALRAVLARRAPRAF